MMIDVRSTVVIKKKTITRSRIEEFHVSLFHFFFVSLFSVVVGAGSCCGRRAKPHSPSDRAKCLPRKITGFFIFYFKMCSRSLSIYILYILHDMFFTVISIRPTNNTVSSCSSSSTSSGRD
jgi:hypothetical protein